MSGLPIFRSLQPREITLTAFEVQTPNIKATEAHTGRGPAARNGHDISAMVDLQLLPCQLQPVSC